MATILEIKLSNNVNIRVKTLPSSILKTEDADMRDVVANELRDRGVIRVEATGDLAAQTHDNTKLVLVWNVGFFVVVETGVAPDDDITFASADAGWVWKKVIAVEPARDKLEIDADHEYVLADGFMLYEIWLWSENEQEGVKIGTTNGGDEIMLADTLSAGAWRAVDKKIFASGADQSVFITGVSDVMTVIIYKKRI